MNCIINLPRRFNCNEVITADRIVLNEIPTGDLNCSNLDFVTNNEFLSDTIEVFLDGRKLDTVDYTVGLDNQSFTLVLDPNNNNSLNKPPRYNEIISVNYIKTYERPVGCVLNLY